MRDRREKQKQQEKPMATSTGKTKEKRSFAYPDNVNITIVPSKSDGSIGRLLQKIQCRDLQDAIADPDVFGAKITLIPIEDRGSLPDEWWVSHRLRNADRIELLKAKIRSILEDWEIECEVTQ